MIRKSGHPVILRGALKTEGRQPIEAAVRGIAAQGARFVPALTTRFDQGLALFVVLSIAGNCTTKLPAFPAVKEPLSGPNTDDHFALGTLHLPRRSLLQQQTHISRDPLD